MKTYFSHKVIKRCKKYNYKIWEETKHNNIEGYITSYYVTDYAETKTICSNNMSYSAIQDFVDEYEQQQDNYSYGGIEKTW